MHTQLVQLTDQSGSLATRTIQRYIDLLMRYFSHGLSSIVPSFQAIRLYLIHTDTVSHQLAKHKSAIRLELKEDRPPPEAKL